MKLDIHYLQRSAPLSFDSNLFKIEISLELDFVGGMKTTQKEQLEKKYFKFSKYWDSSAEAILKPAVFIAEVPFSEIDPKFQDILTAQEGFDFFESSNNRILYTVWTLGRVVEDTVADFFSLGSPMQAIFLDIAGSKMLLRIHKVLQQWIAKNIANPVGWNIVKEIYPGNNFFGVIDLKAFLEKTEAPESLKPVAEGSMLTPCKSMYALFVLGEGPQHIVTSLERCPNCLGSSCLYRQLGGCHLPLIDE